MFAGNENRLQDAVEKVGGAAKTPLEQLEAVAKSVQAGLEKRDKVGQALAPYYKKLAILDVELARAHETVRTAWTSRAAGIYTHEQHLELLQKIYRDALAELSDALTQLKASEAT